MENLKKIDALSFIIGVSLLALNIFLWQGILWNGSPKEARAYFLDVGQGDSELMVFQGGIKVMTDAGPDQKVLDGLGKIISSEDPYIDLAIISHPQLDHFNGYNYILEHYDIGAFIHNGRDDTPGVKQWQELLQKIKEKNIPLITLGKGDAIRYGNNEIDLLSPDGDFDQSAELNDTGLVELVKTPEMRVLLTADIGSNVEDALLAAGDDLRADVLKVPHHGSRYSSGGPFLHAVDPKAAVIEVGARNTYGHPSPLTVARLGSSTRAVVLRTDLDGTITIWAENQALKIERSAR